MIDLFGHVFNCAHRGASGWAPENTLVALTQAIQMGADMAEIDVQETADGQLVLFHDDQLDRTSNGRGLLSARTLSELRRLDAGSWFDRQFAGEPIATLAEAMSLARGRMALNIELKAAEPSPHYLAHVVQTIAEQGFAGQCVVTSFNRDLIAELGAGKPDFAVGLIIGRQGQVSGEVGSPVDLLSLEKSLVSPEVLAAAAATGQAVHAWTVNDSQEMSRLIALGVGGVITNFPDRFPESGPQPNG